MGPVYDGTYNATCSYVTDSDLMAGIEFKQNRTLRMTMTNQYGLLNRLTDSAPVTGRA